MTRIIYRNKNYFISDIEENSRNVYQQLDVTPGHDLVLVRPEGNLLVNRRSQVKLVDNDTFIDAPIFEYGQEKKEVG